YSSLSDCGGLVYWVVKRSFAGATNLPASGGVPEDAPPHAASESAPTPASPVAATRRRVHSLFTCVLSSCAKPPDPAAATPAGLRHHQCIRCTTADQEEGWSRFGARLVAQFRAAGGDGQT